MPDLVVDDDALRTAEHVVTAQLTHLTSVRAPAPLPDGAAPATGSPDLDRAVREHLEALTDALTQTWLRLAAARHALVATGDAFTDADRGLAAHTATGPARDRRLPGSDR